MSGSSFTAKRIFQTLVVFCILSCPARAEQLPIKIYRTTDGLAQGMVTSIYQDSKGYLWFSTFEGLSRFDGYRFVNYDSRNGLNHSIINHVTEDRSGHLWVATNGGGVACLLDDAANRPVTLSTDNKFVSYPVGDTLQSNCVNRMLFDAQNILWCLTDAGLYRGVWTNTNLNFEAVCTSKGASPYAALEDHYGQLWFGLLDELIVVSQTQTINYGTVGGVSNAFITGIIEDHRKRLLVTSEHGLFEFVPPPDSQQRGQWRQLPLTLKRDQAISSILEDKAGFLWLGTTAGLIKYQEGQQTEYTTAQGLSINTIRSLAEDSDSNLWLGTAGDGVCKLSGEWLVNYTLAEGLSNPVVAQIFADRTGRIKAVLNDYTLVELDAGTIRPSQQLDDLPISLQSFMIEHDEQGRWWWGKRSGWWARFRKLVVRLRGGRDLRLADFFPANASPAYVHFYEDQGGKLWMSNGDGNLYCADTTKPGKLVFESFPTDLPLVTSLPLMISDRADGLWLGNRSRLCRLWQKKFIELQPTDGLPDVEPRCFFMDSRGWLWIGLRYNGVSVTKEPNVEHSSFVNYSVAQGLSSGSVGTIAEDDFGRMYFGTARGLDQFDSNTNQWRHYTTQDGLAGNSIYHLYKDQNGNIWVATVHGISRFNPGSEHTQNRPAPIYFSRVNIAGEDLPLPETGTAQIPPLELGTTRNNLAIEFVALSFQGNDSLTYEYQLVGVDRDWSTPTKSRSVNYARLAPGSYRFLVRAINKENTPSPNPAILEFRILPPLYQRWWFMSLTITFILAAASALYRYRINRLLELERVRTRIAGDLHDDIGANLTKISILSEVAHQQLASENKIASHLLSSIATISRESAASMRDIVWAINPKRDRLLDLTRRMRGFASDILTSRDIEFRFSAPDRDHELKLSPEVRRDVFLIFKEAINNIVRHANCTKADIELRVEGQQLILMVSDNGKGLVSSENGEGHGISSMRRRAKNYGGNLEIRSNPGNGTTFRLTVPIGRRR